MARDDDTAWTIRPAADADEAAMAALWQRCGLTVAHNDPRQDIAFCRATPTSELFVADAGGEVVGTVMCGHDGHRGWLYYVAVDPGRQRQGIGRRLVRQGERWLKEAGVAKVNLMIRPSNHAVQAFYRALGYPDTPRHVMGRFLSGDAQENPEISTTVTWLEMDARPDHLPAVAVPRGTAFLRAEEIPLRYYRYLYDEVGGPWMWWERRAMPDDELAAEIHAQGVEIFVLYRHGAPAGFVELDRRPAPVVNVAYAGLMPDAIGQGLGLAMMTWAVETAWSSDPEKVTVNTCTLDHPRALAMYQRVGFHPRRQETIRFADPRATGLFPADWPLPAGYAHDEDAESAQDAASADGSDDGKVTKLELPRPADVD